MKGAEMQKGNKSLKGRVQPHGEKQSTPCGIILERFKKLNANGAPRTDLVSEFFVHYYLRRKRSSI